MPLVETELKDSLLVQCMCSSHILEISKYEEADSDYKEYYIEHYFLADKTYSKWKLLWNIIRGRKTCIEEIVLSSKQFQDFKDKINNF